MTEHEADFLADCKNGFWHDFSDLVNKYLDSVPEHLREELRTRLSESASVYGVNNDHRSVVKLLGGPLSGRRYTIPEHLKDRHILYLDAEVQFVVFPEGDIPPGSFVYEYWLLSDSKYPRAIFQREWNNGKIVQGGGYISKQQRKMNNDHS